MKYFVNRPFSSVHRISESYFRLLQKRYKPVSVIETGKLASGENYKVIKICNG